MRYRQFPSRSRLSLSAPLQRVVRLATAVLLSLGVLVSLFLLLPIRRARAPIDPLPVEDVESSRSGIGGRWHIPPSWLDQATRDRTRRAPSPIESIVEAAECALDRAWRQHAFLDNTNIPLIVHQTWKTSDLDVWPDIMKQRVGEWLSMAVDDGASHPHGAQMAWLFWDDDGILELIRKYEPDMFEDFKELPFAVEKADLFRVVVLKWFGGIYSDVDTQPLKHPSGWIYDTDLLPWVEPNSERNHTLHKPRVERSKLTTRGPTSYQSILDRITSDRETQTTPPVDAIFGIEADNPPAPNPTYWRMGYTYAVQVTNWALAMSPLHPVADQVIQNFRSKVAEERKFLRQVDPLAIAGPPALTAAVRAVAEREDPELSWDALSARNGDPPGGRGKVVAGDVMILPITGFSPGRGWFQNMGSQGLDHANARLRHAANGSWRKVQLRIEYGKLCRVLFGMCKDWELW